MSESISHPNPPISAHTPRFLIFVEAHSCGCVESPAELYSSSPWGVVLRNCYLTPLRLSAVFLFLAVSRLSLAQQPPPEQPPDDVEGKWTIYCKNVDNGKTSTKYIEIKQNGNELTGRFKGPNQSGGLEGTIHVHHIVFRTKTRNVLTFAAASTATKCPANSVSAANTANGKPNAPTKWHGHSCLCSSVQCSGQRFSSDIHSQEDPGFSS